MNAKDPINEEPFDLDEGGSGKSKKRKKKIKNKKQAIGSARGIETMFRNAYRVELGLISLAATKANIMISLNGFIVSALMISGGFIYASRPLFLVPITLFLFTSAISIYYALMAASPDTTPIHNRVFAWVRDLIKRKTGVWDFKRYVFPKQPYVEGKSNILIYEDRVRLSKLDYLEHMHQLLGAPEEIYEKMSDQLYWLGLITDKKFRMLRLSYAVFRWGIVLSVLVFISVKSFDFIGEKISDVIAVHTKDVGIGKFEKIYEPSAVQQLPDKRLLVVEDEASRAFSIVSFRADGSISENTLLDNQLLKSFNRKLNDLEGVTLGPGGYIYAITSHSRTQKGKRKKNRELLLRFKIKGDKLVYSAAFTELTDYLIKSGVLNNIKSGSGKQNVSFQDINIEAFNFDKNQNKLLLGFRTPLIDGKSMLIAIENPEGIFERNEPPKIAHDVTLLDLNGGGIRSLDYDSRLDGYLMVNEVVGEDDKRHSQLWFWKGDADQKPRPIALPEIINLKNVESVAPITVNGKDRLLLLSDDGNAKKDKPAHYMLLEYEQLSID